MSGVYPVQKRQPVLKVANVTCSGVGYSSKQIDTAEEQACIYPPSPYLPTSTWSQKHVGSISIDMASHGGHWSCECCGAGCTHPANTRPCSTRVHEDSFHCCLSKSSHTPHPAPSLPPNLLVQCAGNRYPTKPAPVRGSEPPHGQRTRAGHECVCRCAGEQGGKGGEVGGEGNLCRGWPGELTGVRWPTPLLSSPRGRVGRGDRPHPCRKHLLQARQTDKHTLASGPKPWR